MGTRKIFSIRFKIAIIILVNVLILTGLIYLVSTMILSKSYLEIEKNEVVKNLQRANDAIENNLSELSTRLADWAVWDDTYQFIQDKNEEYVKSNLGDTSIFNIKINAMVFVDAKGEVIFKKGLDLKEVKEISVEDLGAHILAHRKLTTYENTDSSIAGLIMLPGGPLFIASHPVLTSSSEGPIKGGLLFAKFFNDEMVKALGELTHLSVKLYDFYSISLPTDVLEAKLSLLRKENEYFVNSLSGESVAGYKVLYDIYKKPILLVKIEGPRQIYNQGLFTLRFFIFFVSGLIILFGLFLLFFITKFIISPLLNLSKEVEKISTTGDLSFRVKEEKEDEIGKLAGKINNMLEALSLSRKAETETEGKVQVFGTELKKQVEELEQMNKLMVDRELKMMELKKEIEELKKSNK